MRSFPRPFLIIAMFAGSGASVTVAQKVELPKCEKPEGDQKITTFTVDLPVPLARAQGRVVRVFTAIGLPPSGAATLSNQVEWDSGTETNAITGDNRRRKITATLMEGEREGTTTVLVAPLESNVDTWSQSSVQPLSNKNSGYGFKVWCAARVVSDSLKAAAERLGATKGDSVKPPP